MSEEVNIRACKVCKRLLKRILAGKFPNGRDKKWIDENGKLWSGSTCGECNSKRISEIQKKKKETPPTT